MRKTILLSVFVCAYATAIHAQSADVMKANAKGAITAIANHDFAKFLSYLSENSTDYSMGAEPLKGKQAIEAAVKDFATAFPDYKVDIEGVAVDGDKAYVPNTFKGTQSGILAGMIPATNKTVVWKDIDVMQFDKTGKITAHWAVNSNTVLDQIGYHAYTVPATMVVMQGYQNFGKGNFGSITDACTDDVSWDVTDNPSAKVANIYKGKSEVTNFFKVLGDNMQIIKFEPYRFFADGDEVTVFIHTTYKLDGKEYNANLVHYFMIKNEKIASFKEYVDTPVTTGM
ncbi:MAG TPA: nuclear transport factor 2 family protein [Panacibacter sp.]|nr:nuclear transport factor 2 family protein [Panacibacter sp.]